MKKNRERVAFYNFSVWQEKWKFAKIKKIRENTAVYYYLAYPLSIWREKFRKFFELQTWIKIRENAAVSKYPPSIWREKQEIQERLTLSPMMSWKDSKLFEKCKSWVDREFDLFCLRAICAALFPAQICRPAACLLELQFLRL